MSSCVWSKHACVEVRGWPEVSVLPSTLFAIPYDLLANPCSRDYPVSNFPLILGDPGWMLSFWLYVGIGNSGLGPHTVAQALPTQPSPQSCLLSLARVKISSEVWKLGEQSRCPDRRKWKYGQDVIVTLYQLWISTMVDNNTKAINNVTSSKMPISAKPQ